MYGAVKYAQTQYAHPGTLAAKWKLFLEFITLEDNRNIRVKKSWQSVLNIYEIFKRAIVYKRLIKEFVYVSENINKFFRPLYRETIRISDNLSQGIKYLYIELIKIADILSYKWARFKVFTELVKVSFSRKANILKALLDNIFVKDSDIKGFSRTFISQIKINDVMGFTPFKYIREWVNVKSVLGKKFVRGWLEKFSLEDIYHGLPSGIVFSEVLRARDFITHRTSKTFQSFVSTVDVIRLQLNGFLLRWTKRTKVNTEWEKKEFPSNTWQKKYRRSVDN